MKIKTIYQGTNKALCEKLNTQSRFIKAFQMDYPLGLLSKKGEIDLIILEAAEEYGNRFWLTEFFAKQLSESHVLLFVICTTDTLAQYKKSGADGVFTFDTPIENIDTRILLLQPYKANLRGTIANIKNHLTKLRKNEKETLTRR